MTGGSRRYVPDLKGWQQLCEDNYCLLTYLLPHQVRPGDVWLFGTEPLPWQLEVVAVSRYCWDLRLSQQKMADIGLAAGEIQLRMYHDARLAEVTLCQRRRVWRGRYPYPNRHMHQVDEKSRINHFLHDILRYCLQQRRVRREEKAA